MNIPQRIFVKVFKYFNLICKECFNNLAKSNFIAFSPAMLIHQSRASHDLALTGSFSVVIPWGGEYNSKGVQATVDDQVIDA